MKKVLCIDAAPRMGEIYLGYDVKEGEIYTVIKEAIGYSFDDTDDKEYPCYKLAEFSDRQYNLFDKDRFIPLSDIDQSEETRERFKNIDLAKSFTKLKN